MSKNWIHAAGILWPVLVVAAKNREKPIYKELAPLISTNPLSVGKALEHIQSFCMESKLPPLSAIVVSKTTGLPGGGFIAWDIDDIDTAFEKVYEFPWGSIQNPFGGFLESDTIESLSDELIKTPSKAKEIYTKVENRGIAQKIFRAALLKAYDSKCAICGFSFQEALEAAHILPWPKANAEERISPRNGILLCSNHHKLFDSDIIKINEELVVFHAQQGKKYSDVDRVATIDYHGKPLSLPKYNRLAPSVELVHKRYSKD